MNAFLNPNFFLKIISNNLVLWDYGSHKQYILEEAYLLRLVEIAKSAGKYIEKNSIDDDLLASGVISLDAFPDSSWGWDPLAHIFHHGTRDIPQDHDVENPENWAKSYIDYCEDVTEKTFPAAPLPRSFQHKIFLPKPQLEELDSLSGLWETLCSRKTSRVFLDQFVSLEKASTLLYSSFGYIAERTQDILEFVPEFLRKRKTSPSGGGLSASDAYLVALRVTGLQPGIYFYDAEHHALALQREIDLSSDLGKLLSGQYFANNLSLGVFVVSRFDKMWWKYEHSRAYRVSLLDVGHLSQTFQLCATALDLQTWLTAAFVDSEVDQLLGLENGAQQPILFLGVGVGNGDSLDQERRQILESDQRI